MKRSILESWTSLLVLILLAVNPRSTASKSDGNYCTKRGECNCYVTDDDRWERFKRDADLCYHTQFEDDLRRTIFHKNLAKYDCYELIHNRTSVKLSREHTLTEFERKCSSVLSSKELARYINQISSERGFSIRHDIADIRKQCKTIPPKTKEGCYRTYDEKYEEYKLIYKKCNKDREEDLLRQTIFRLTDDFVNCMQDFNGYPVHDNLSDVSTIQWWCEIKYGPHFWKDNHCLGKVRPDSINWGRSYLQDYVSSFVKVGSNETCHKSRDEFWEEYKRFFNKCYRDKEEDEHRKSIFYAYNLYTGCEENYFDIKRRVDQRSDKNMEELQWFHWTKIRYKQNVTTSDSCAHDLRDPEYEEYKRRFGKCHSDKYHKFRHTIFRWHRFFIKCINRIFRESPITYDETSDMTRLEYYCHKKYTSKPDCIGEPDGQFEIDYMKEQMRLSEYEEEEVRKRKLRQIF